MTVINKTETIAFFDIDGTLRRTVDPWMLLHKYLNTDIEGGKYYDMWVNNKISYDEMTRLDAALWKGESKTEMLKVLDINPLRDGAKALINWFKQRDIPCYGISTGLSFLNDITAKETGLDMVVSNNVLFNDDICTGDVEINVREDSKADVMDNIIKQFNGNVKNILSFGDGIADVEMFRKSTMSVAIFPKNDFIKESASIAVNSEPIDSVTDIINSHIKN